MLLVFLGAAVTGVLQIGLLDPLALLARSLGTAVLPGIHVAADGLLEWVRSLGIGPSAGERRRSMTPSVRCF